MCYVLRTIYLYIAGYIFIFGILYNVNNSCVMQAAQSEPWLEWITANDKWFSFCNFALLNFVQNDLFWAVRQFLDHAHGSFGLAVVSEADPGCLVLAAHKQPMTLTFAPHSG